MGTLMDKLNATNATKEQIRQAIERKKVSVPTNTPLKDYPAKIDGIYPDALFLRDSKISNSRNVRILEDTIFENGVYITSGSYQISTSNDYYAGTESQGWTRYTLDARNSLNPHIVFGNGVFAMSYIPNSNSRQVVVVISSDGVHWSNTQVVYSISYGYFTNSGIAFNGKEFVVSAQDRDSELYFFKSSNGVAWNEVASNVRGVQGIFAENFKFISKNSSYCFYSDTRIYISTDLYTWDRQSFDNNTTHFDVPVSIINGVAFVSYYTSYNSGSVKYYDESRTWKPLDSPAGSQLLGGCFKNGQYILVFRMADSKTTGAYNSLFTVWTDNLETIGKVKKYWFGVGYDTDRMPKHVSFANNKFFMFFGGGTSMFSHDGVSWFENIDKVMIDTSDKDVTYETLIKMNGISTATLQAAYEAGVNSI